MKTVYYSLVYPYLRYGITIWGEGTYHSHLSKLIIMQNKIIRTTTGAKYKFLFPFIHFSQLLQIFFPSTFVLYYIICITNLFQFNYQVGVNSQ